MDIIPYFKFPVQVVFLDDDELFFDGIKKYIKSDSKSNVMSTNVVEIMEKNVAAHPICSMPTNFLDDINLNEVDDDKHYSVSAINYEHIVNIIYKKERVKEPAVFVVDYAMPAMSGVDFFKKIKESRAKKILQKELELKMNEEKNTH